MEEDKKHRKLISSSMVDLKAELSRKQEEFRKQKEQNAAFTRPKKSVKDTKSIWNIQNPGVLARAQKDLDTKEKDVEEEEMLAKSRRILEQKTKVYDSITNSSTIPEEDGSEYYLVDFQKKAADAIVEERESRRRLDKQNEEDEAERNALSEEIPEASCPEDEWVDFVDSLGRERRCMKKDLNSLIKKDQELALAQGNKRESNHKTDNNLEPGGSSTKGGLTSKMSDLMSADMHRELMRQKWESEAKELLEKGQDEVHYSNVQFDEIRAHGVGFYQFSKDHTKRQEELDKLRKLREETINQQSTKEKIKDKRKAMLEVRLAKVRQRRKLKGEVTEDEKPTQQEADKDKSTSTLQDSVSSSKTEEDVKKEEGAKDAEEKRKKHVREWDKDKQQSSTWGVENYMTARRKERESEFAPPSLYFEENMKTKKTKDSNQVLSDDDRLKRLQGSISTPVGNETIQQSTAKSALSSVDGKSLKALNSVDSIPLPEGPATSHSKDVAQQGGLSLQSNNPSYCVPQLPANIPQQQQHTIDGVSQFCSSEQANNSWQNWNPATHSTPSQHYYHSSQQTSQSHNLYAMTQNNQYFQPQACIQNSEGPLVWNPSQSCQVWNPNQSCQTSGNNYIPQYNHGPNPTLTSTSRDSRNVAMEAASSNVSSNVGTKSSTHKHHAAEPPAAKKPKVPKLSVVDMRYMNNFDTSSINPEPGRVPDVSGVPYTPGTFSKYRPQGVDGSAQSTTDAGNCETGAAAQDGAQISGGPLIYTQEQIARQQQELDEQRNQPENVDSDDDHKLQEFLSSIRASSN